MKITICKNGKEIGTTAAENVKMEHDYEPIYLGNTIVKKFLKSRTIYVRFEDVVFNADVKMVDPIDTYEFCADYFKLPKGVRKPKKKRILNKYKKKYTNKFVWKYCQIRFEEVCEFSS
jgi:hypothetical protein